MGRKLRRADRAISENEVIYILQNGEYGILSTVSANGQPYGVPLNYTYSANVIYFHCALEGHKIENIKQNNKVSFCVVGKTEVLPSEFATRYESVIVFGEIFEITGDEKHKALLELIKKYSPKFIDQGLKYIETDGDKTKVYKIVIESITGKAKK